MLYYYKKGIVMKNVVWIVIGVFSFFCYSTFLSANAEKSIEYFLLLGNVEALASNGELPEFEFVCGAEDGRCWTGECGDVAHTPFGSYRCWICDRFTGMQKDVCFDGVPC